MALTWVDVTDMAPQMLATVPPVSVQTSILNFVNNRLDPDAFEDANDFDLCQRLLAAHFAEVWRRKGQLGLVQREEIGVSSVSFGYLAKILNNPLEATPYGEQVLGIIAAAPARVGFVL